MASLALVYQCMKLGAWVSQIDPTTLRCSDAMKFNGPAPERINGRLAMLGITFGVWEEIKSGHGIIWQAHHPNPWITVLFLAITWASLVPIRRGVVDEDFAFFTVKAEKLNGRAAMVGFASLLALEAVFRVALFGGH